ncbi:hypothetical protein [Bradyrhizobium centrosematis]|uniref:hypothetical protein n=1 Tax=Bradyrhizobium centrosematis TaxID=1300039 RepID=UPI00388DFC3C
MLSERAQHREPAFLPEEVCQDGRSAVYRGGRPEVRRACCPEPGSRSVQARSSVLRSAREWLLAPARRDEPEAWLSEQAVSPLAPARGARTEPLPGAAEGEVLESGEPLAAGAWTGCAAAAPRRAAVSAPAEPQAVQEAAVSVSAELQAAPEAVVSGHAAAEPQPAAAKAASAQQAAGVAAAGRDEPQGAAEAEAALPVAAVRLPAGAPREDGAAQPRAAVRTGARALPAERQRVPSAAASVFRQGQSLEAGPARPRAAAHLAHAMRCL